MLAQYDWCSGRCLCCRKKTEIVLGLRLNMTAKGWSNMITRAKAQDLAREGVCPWCGRRTTIVSKVLMGRFEPHLMSICREFEI